MLLKNILNQVQGELLVRKDYNGFHQGRISKWRYKHMAEKLDFQVIATTLLGAVDESVSVFLKAKPDKEPDIKTKVLYAQDKLNVSTYAEFVDGSYISVIYLYRHEKDKGSNRFCGMLIVYVSTAAINYLIKGFGYKNAAEAGVAMAEDAVGELANNIAGIFKRDLRGLGYAEFEISTPLKFKGFSGDLDFPKGQKNFHRVTAYVWGQTIVFDAILAI